LFTIEEYLAFERASDEHHEYLDGVIYAMAGESPNHGTICVNLTASLVSNSNFDFSRGSRLSIDTDLAKVEISQAPRRQR